MPTPAISLPTGLFSTTVYPFTITIEGVGSIANSLLHYPSLVIEDTATDDYNGQVSFRYWDSDNTRPVAHEAVVRVYDDTIDQQVFLGFVRAFHYEAQAVGRWVVIDQAVHVGKLLDETIVPFEPRPSGEGTKARFSYIWGKYARQPFTPDVTYVNDVDASLPQDVMTNTTLYGAIRQIAELSGSSVRFYVDAQGRPHLFSGTESTPGAAPFNINVALAPGGGNIAPDSLTVQTDGPIKNRYYVRGANAEGSGWYQDDASVATYGPREDYLDAPSSDSAEKAQAIAQLQLGRVAQPNVRGSFSTAHPNDGWRAGQNVTITSAQDGLSAYATRIVKVRTTFLTGEATPKRHYEMEFSDTGATLSGVPSSQGAVGGAVVGQVIRGDVISAPEQIVMSTTDNGGQSAFFGPAARRFLLSGFENGDYFWSPPAINAQVTTANPIPRWTFTQSSGVGVRASCLERSDTASGVVIRLDMHSGAAGDDGYVEQFVPVSGSYGQSFAYKPVMGCISGPTTSDIEVYISVQYVTEDYTATGSSHTTATTLTSWGASTYGEIATAPSWLSAVPSDAYWLRVRFGLRRAAAATSQTGYVDLTEARLQVGWHRLFVVDQESPGTYNGGLIGSTAGDLIIQANEGAPAGTSPTITMSASTGSITLNPGAGSLEGVVLDGEWVYIDEAVGIPAAPVVGGRLYIIDNGAGKMSLRVRFPSGAAQTIATEP